MIRLAALPCLFALLVLSGCAASERGNGLWQTWKGRAETDLVAAFGAPDTMYETGDRRVLNYERRQRLDLLVLGGGTAHGGNPNVVDTTGGDPMTFYFYCRTTFVLGDGVVVGLTTNGNSCN